MPLPYIASSINQFLYQARIGTALVTTEAGEAAGMMKYFPFV
jgi:hypothetical protein